MSGTTIHKQARTTPQLREEIRNAPLSERALAEKYNVSRSTVRKWKYRETAVDRNYRPHRLHTALSLAQESIVVELRRSLLLSTDDLLVVVREFIQPDLNRSTLQPLLVRHEVSNLRDLVPQPEGRERRSPLDVVPSCPAGCIFNCSGQNHSPYLFTSIML